MRFFPMPRKLQRVLAGLLLVFTLVVSVNPNCEAFSIRIPILTDMYDFMTKGLTRIIDIIINIPNMMVSIIDNIVGLFKLVADLAGGGLRSQLDELSKTILSANEKDEQTENKARDQSRDINNYSTQNTDTLQNSIDAFNQRGSAPCGDKGASTCTSTNSATIQDTSAFGGKEHTEVANNFTLNSTGAHVGVANPVRPRTLEEEDLRAKAIHDVIASNQSIAGEGQVKAQSRLSGAGKDGKSSRQNTKDLIGPLGDPVFWQQVMKLDPGAFITFTRGTITHFFAVSSFIFKTCNVVMDILFSTTGIVSMITFIANMTIGAVTIASTAVSSSPIGKSLKKNMG